MKIAVPTGIGNSIQEVVTETSIDKSHDVVMWMLHGLDVVDMKYCRTEISGGRQAERSAFPWLEFHYIIDMYSAIYVSEIYITQSPYWIPATKVRVHNLLKLPFRI